MTTTTSNVANLADFKRRFVRAKKDSSWPSDDETPEDDTFFLGIVCAEMAAHHDEIDCGACGSKDIVRMPLSAPDRFGTVTTKTGHLYGYALCGACYELRKSDFESLAKRVDDAFDRALGATALETG